MKILVVKLHALGDMVIITPAVKFLKEHLPSAQIDVLTTEWAAPAIRHNPNVDEIRVCRNELFFNPELATIAPTFELWMKLRKIGYDAMVLYHKHWAIRKYFGSIGVKQTFAFGDQSSNTTVKLDENRHSALTALELSILTVTAIDGNKYELPRLTDIKYDWVVSEPEETESMAVLNKHNLETEKFVAIFPGGGVNPSDSGLIKRWSAGGFTGLADRLTNYKSMKVVLLGGETDKDVCQKVKDAVNSSVIDLSGKLSIRVTAALLKHSRLVITNDSAPLHIAAAVGVRTFGIFGPTGAEHKLPPGSKSAGISSKIPCSPCYFTTFKGCIFNEIRCLEELDVDRVMSTVEEHVNISSVSELKS